MNTPKIRYEHKRKSALITGIALMIMMFADFFSYGFVHASLLVPGDAAATLRNIMLSGSL